MRVIQVVAAISEEASGPSYCVVRLCESVMREGCDASLAVLNWGPMGKPPAPLKTFPLATGPRRLGCSPQMRHWLENQARSRQTDLIHNHGLWMMPNLYASWAARKSGVPLMISPHGSLSKWAFSRGSRAKRLFWPLLQRSALDAATCFHATAMSELEDIRCHGFRQPVALIPNGVDIPALEAKISRRGRGVLFLGRVHPTKGLDLLLPAWGRLESRFPDWHLLIAGPDELGHRAEMERLARRLRLVRVDFGGPLYGEEKWRAYRDADLFVLPTRSENFGMTVAEALAAGTPVVVTKGAPWAAVEEQGAGWWTDISVESLAAALEDAMSRRPDELVQMGRAGRKWVAQEFSWRAIGRRMLETYRWMVDGGKLPPWVRC